MTHDPELAKVYADPTPEGAARREAERAAQAARPNVCVAVDCPWCGGGDVA